MTCRLFCKFSLQPVTNSFGPYIQIASYLAPPLPEDVQKRLDEHRSFRVNHQADVQCNEDIQLDMHDQKQRWARFGSCSGVNIAGLFPSKKEISEEREAEIRWWPTLQKMQQQIKRKNDEKLREVREREKKIAENMSKMKEWIAKFEAEQHSTVEKQEMLQRKKEIEEDEAREAIGYDVPSKHPVLREYLNKQKEMRKKEKKLLKKMR